MKRTENRFLKSHKQWLRAKKGGGGGGGSQTVTQVSEPPDYVVGPATRFLQRAEELSNTPYSTYGGQRISPLNSFHNTGLHQGQYAQNLMLPAAAQGMMNFATGAYSQPAYLHPFAGQLMPMGGQMNPFQGFPGISMPNQPQVQLPQFSPNKFGGQQQPGMQNMSAGVQGFQFPRVGPPGNLDLTPIEPVQPPERQPEPDPPVQQPGPAPGPLPGEPGDPRLTERERRGQNPRRTGPDREDSERSGRDN